MSKEHIYFMGIGGTGMGSAAGLIQQAGFHVTGSDAGVYPPMSDVLSESGIEYKTPYSPENLQDVSPDQVVVANALSPGHEELECAVSQKLKLTSFPALVSEKILAFRRPIVVSGTHGKTTTTTLAAHVLKSLGYDIGYLIGGLPRNFKRGYELGEHPLFLLEGDEYDTAYFDKESKFLHYRPEFLIFNNLEFDHADIFANLDEIDRAFEKLINLVPNKKNILANIDDEGVVRVLKKLGIENSVTRVSGFGENQGDVVVKELGFNAASELWNVRIEIKGEMFEFNTELTGPHNMCNLAQVIALAHRLEEESAIEKFSIEKLQEVVASFKGVARRMDRLGERNGTIVFEDFAHHPTSVKLVLQSLKGMYPEKRLIVAFEPKNATSRRSIFTENFAEGLSQAELVLIGACPPDKRVAAEDKMDTELLSSKITSDSKAFKTNEDLLSHATQLCGPNDVLVFMSPGSFSGIQHKFVSGAEV